MWRLGRSKQTARKSTGPRRKTSSDGTERAPKQTVDGKYSPHNKTNWALHNGKRPGLNCSMIFRDHDEDVSDVEEEAYHVEDAETLEPLVLDHELAYQFGFEVSREPFVFKHPKPSANLRSLKTLAFNLIPTKGTYLVIWIGDDDKWQGEGDAAVQAPSYNKELKAMLKNPTLEGQKNYVLKGNREALQAALFAKRDIPVNDPVGLETGAIWQEEKFLEMQGNELDQMIGLFATDIDADLFTQILGKRYKGGNLVYDCITHGNELRFMHDPTWYCSDARVQEANIGSFVVLTKEEPYVYIVYFALKDISEGDELVVRYGDKTWDDIYCLQLAGQARMARACEQRVKDTETLIIDAGRALPDVVPAGPYDKGKITYYDSKHDHLLSLDNDMKWSESISELEESDPIGAVLLKIRRGSKRPLSHIRVDPIGKKGPPKTCEFPSALTRTEVLVASDEIKSRLAKTLKRAPEDKKVWKEHGQRLRAIASGSQKSYIQLVKVDNPFSPARLFAPPNEDCYAIVAACNIKSGQPITQYAGELLYESNSSIDSSNAYLYELGRPEMAARGYKGETLLVNASTVGGLSRFVNDIWTPPGFPERQSNCFLRLLCDTETSLPMIVCFAQCDIKQGEELLYDYGNKYWRVMFKSMMHTLTAYALKSQHRYKHLREWLAEVDEPLSKKLKLDPIPGAALPLPKASPIAPKEKENGEV